MGIFTTYKRPPAIPDALKIPNDMAYETINLTKQKAVNILKVSLDLLADSAAWETVRRSLVNDMDTWAEAQGLTRIEPASFQHHPPADPDDARLLLRERKRRYALFGTYAAIPEGFEKPILPDVIYCDY